MESHLQDIILKILQYGIIILMPLATLCLILYFGRHLSEKYKVTGWYFWTAYLCAVPVIAAPLVLFGSMFMDHVKHEILIPAAWVMINTYAGWFILGFICSMKLYGLVPKYLSILPSPLSWIFAAIAIWGGIWLVNF